MLFNRALISIVFCLAGPAWANGEFITAGYEHARLDPALERVKSNPNRHVMVYLGAYGCGPCQFTAHQLNISEVAAKLRSQVIVVEAFAWYPRNEEDLRVVKQYGKASWRMPSVAPVLAVLDNEGNQVVRLVGGLGSTREALLLGDFLTGRHYKRTSFHSFVAEHWR